MPEQILKLQFSPENDVVSESVVALKLLKSTGSLSIIL